MEKTIRTVGIVGVVALVLGMVAWIMQLSGGLLAGTDMTNIFLWGLMIAAFAFMVGFGAGAQFVAAAIYLTGKTELYGLARTACAVALACVGSAGIAIMADLGAVRNIMDMVFGLNIASPLAWDMIAFALFAVVSLIQLIAMARDSKATKALVLATAVVALGLQVVEGLLFSSQTAHAWWATPIMPIDFVAVAFVSGSALMLLIAYVGKAGTSSLAWLAKFCACAIAVHLVLALADFALVALEGTPVAGGVLAAIGSVWFLYAGELVLPAVAMVLLFLYAKKAASGASGTTATNTPTATTGAQSDAKSFVLAGSILTIVGVFLHRLMLLYPAYNAPAMYLKLSGTDFVTGPYPVSTGRYLDWGQTFSTTTAYVPSGLEWLSLLLPIGIGIVATIVLLWCMKKVAKRPQGSQE